MLILERHDLHLRSFPEGSFSHQIIAHARAKSLIEEAIANKQLYATFKHDNLNPPKADNEFLKFLRVLEDHYRIAIDPAQFFDEELNEETGELMHFGKPAGLMSIGKGRQLLVVDYCYSMPEKLLEKEDEDEQGEDENFLDWPIAADTVQFHLFEMIDG